MTMKKTLLIAVLALAACIQARPSNFTDSLSYEIRLGYSVGGTMPIGMPATIRGLDRFNLEASVSLGIDVYRRFNGSKWGIGTGLRIENKAMDIAATVKNYHMQMERGGETITGFFTGHNATSVEQWMFTLPVQATFNPNDRWRIRLGPYVSFVHSHKFTGYAYDGYLRVGDPTGGKEMMGTDEGTRGSYDFSDDLRNWQYGIVLGANWRFYKSWGMLVDLTWGVNGIFKGDFNVLEQTLYPIYGTIGFTYRIK